MRSTRRSNWKRALPLLMVWTVLAGGTYCGSAVDPWVLSLFHLSFLAMLTCALPRPRVDAYSFLALFLFLGFWAKFVAHQWFNYPFVEPTGNFNDSTEQWNRALTASSAAALGATLVRVLQLRGRLWFRLHRPVSLSPPAVYLRAPGTSWLVLGFAVLALYLINFYFAFYVTGVNTRLVLPLKLNALVSWAAYCGAGLLVMLVADWEFQRCPDRLWPLVGASCVLGIVMSVSLASRASCLFLFAALVMASFAQGRIPLRRFVLEGGWKWPLLMAAALVVSLVLVSAIRLSIYQVAAPAEAVTAAKVDGQEQAELPPAFAPGEVSTVTAVDNPIAGPVEPPVPLQRLQMTSGHMMHQIMLLSIDRWIGLEGMLALSASGERGPALLSAGLKEDPANGVNSIFQRIAHSVYVYQPGFTYLTLPGFPVVLFYSGSLVLVLAGMAAATALISLIDGIALRLTGSRFMVAWLGLLLANTLCQMSFPYLSLVFIANTSLAMLGYWTLVRLRPLIFSRQAHHA